MRFVGAGLLGAMLVFAAGCQTSRHFPDEAQDTVHELSLAEQAGAQSRARAQLDAARESLEFAQRSEEEASADRREAHLRIAEAHRRLQRSTNRLEERKLQLADEEERQKTLQKKLDDLGGRYDELKKTGVREDDIRVLLEQDVALVKIRVHESETDISTLKSEIELSELEHKDGTVALEAAQAHLETAEKRLSLALALYRRAEEQAKLAHADADASRERELRGNIIEAGNGS